MVIRRYYVEMLWLKHCVRPQWLLHAGALLNFEAQLLSTDKYRRWGRPGAVPRRCLIFQRRSLSGCRAADERVGRVVARREHLEPPLADSPLPEHLRRVWRRLNSLFRGMSRCRR
jgi:hypothetical protein